MKAINACPVCRNTQFNPFGASSPNSGLHSIQVQCSVCDLLISQPQADVEAMNSYYQNVYYQEVWPESTIELETARYHLKKIFFLMGQEIRSARVFEVGCGYGKMLSLIQKLGNECAGCDFSDKAVRYANEKFGLKNVVLDDATNPSNKNDLYDLVLSFHVIEHLPNPVEHLNRLLGLTKSGGWVVVGTENSTCTQIEFERFVDRLKGNEPRFMTSQEHTFVFNSKNLSALFHSCGFEEVKYLCYNENSSEIGRRENFHWFLYKFFFQMLDHFLGRGSFLLVAGRKKS